MGSSGRTGYGITCGCHRVCGHHCSGPKTDRIQIPPFPPGVFTGMTAPIQIGGRRSKADLRAFEKMLNCSPLWGSLLARTLHKIRGQRVARPHMASQQVDRGWIPARMHHPEITEVKPQRQRQEPFDQLIMRCTLLAHLRQERLVLLAVLWRFLTVPEPPCDGIELVVASHDQS